MSKTKVKKLGSIYSNGIGSSANHDYLNIFSQDTLSDYETWKKVNKNNDENFFNEKLFYQCLYQENFGSLIDIYEIISPSLSGIVIFLCELGHPRFKRKLFDEYLVTKPIKNKKKQEFIAVRDNSIIFAYFDPYDLIDGFFRENNKKTKASQAKLKLTFENKFDEICTTFYNNELRMLNNMKSLYSKSEYTKELSKPMKSLFSKIKVKNGDYKLYTLQFKKDAGAYYKGDIVGYFLSL